MLTTTERKSTLSDTGMMVSDTERLRIAQIDLVYRQAVPSLIAAVAAVALLVYVVYDSAPRTQLGIWLIASACLYALRFMLVLSYHKSAPEQRLQRPWHGLFLLGALVGGGLWGISGNLLLPSDSIAHQSFLVVGVTGICAGTAVSYAALRGVPQAFILPALIPFGLQLISAGSDLQRLMGIVVLMFMVVLLISSVMVYKSIERTLRLGLENEGLVQTLRGAKEKAESLNSELRLEVDERRQAEQRIRASRRELSRILDNIQDTYFRTDNAGNIVQVSPSVTELLGYSQRELLGTNLEQLFVDSADVEVFMRALEAGGGRLHGYEMQLVRKDGTRIWVSKNAQYYRDEYGDIAGVEGTGHDVTGLKRVEAALRAEKERALVTLESIGDGVIATDAAGHVEYLNPIAEQLTGWAATSALRRPLSEVFHVIDEDTRQLSDDPVRTCLRSGQACKLPGHPILLSAENDLEYSIEVNVSPILDDSDSVSGVVLVFHDVTELRSLARDMSYQASHDVLTGLVNRREFEFRVETAIKNAVSEDLQHAVCYLDLDQFKVVNDTCGHIAGDELLRQLAVQLQARVRESDTLARLGGDEFGLLLEACPLDKALKIAEQLREVVKTYRFEWEEQSFELGVSIGLVAITSESRSLAETLSAADSACYVAKEAGRNRTHVFSVDDTALLQHHSHMRWVQRLQRALDVGSFELFCQKVHPIKSDVETVQYHEILLRMREEGDELIVPSVFVPAAERYHMMPAIDRWVVRHALQALAGKREWEKGDLFAINLSGQSLGDDDFLDFVQSELDRAAVSPDRICFEITETAAVAKLRSAQRFITTLRRQGCSFALDDFGSGLSSFAYLKRLPIDFLKIDGRFVSDIVSDPVDHAMVESINQLGHAVGVKTIAESVENDAILEHLTRLGVDYVQGFGVHSPESLGGFID